MKTPDRLLREIAEKLVRKDPLTQLEKEIVNNNVSSMKTHYSYALARLDPSGVRKRMRSPIVATNPLVTLSSRAPQIAMLARKKRTMKVAGQETENANSDDEQELDLDQDEATSRPKRSKQQPVGASAVPDEDGDVVLGVYDCNGNEEDDDNEEDNDEDNSADVEINVDNDDEPIIEAETAETDLFEG